jgi:hypothetical protein
LREHQLAVRDTGFMPEPMMIAAAAGESPTLIARDDRVYPLARILDALDGIQLGQLSEARKIAHSLLTDPLPVLRYWAAITAINHPERFDPRQLLKDSNTCVQLASAEALLLREKNADAMQIVETAIIQAREPELRLLALNVLDRTKRVPSLKLRTLLDQLASLDSMVGFDYYNARAARHLQIR